MGCQESKPAAAKANGTPERHSPSESADPKDVKIRNNIFAKPIFEASGFKTPVFPKEQDATTFLLKALPTNFVFENFSYSELNILCQAMEKVQFAKNDLIIKQGDTGDFFYVIFSGTVSFLVDDINVGAGKSGDSFGELSLLYTCPRAATVQATSATVLYRVEQNTFRYILQQQTNTANSEKVDLLKKVTFLSELDDVNLAKLAGVCKAVEFKKNEVIMKKGDTNADEFYILQSGAVKCTDVGAGEVEYTDVDIDNSGDFFGERALITGEPRAATITAMVDTRCFTIDRQTFNIVCGDFKSVIVKSNDTRLLSAIKLISDSQLNSQSLTALANNVQEKSFKPGELLCEADEKTEASLYLIRSGSVTIMAENETRTVKEGGFFGDDQLQTDVGKQRVRLGAAAMCAPTYGAMAGDEGVVCGILTLTSCRKIMDTRLFGKPEASKRMLYDSIVDKSFSMNDLKRHTMLGAGTFGQVWLASRTNALGGNNVYALKVQSKYELVKEGQALAVIQEKNIMSELQHPFLIQLVNTDHDENFVYILLQLIQGGELYSYIHERKGRMPEADARFYAACVADGLGFMHGRGYAYRDLKPENVLVDKEAPKKTFTLCGTPLYLPPETILNRGHNGSADHWSLGILIFELLTGDTPFYKSGLSQMDLFRAIVKAKFNMPKKLSPTAQSIISELLVRNPTQRLGSLAEGENGILNHAWMSEISMDELRLKTLKAPKIPKIKDPLDASNFDDWSHIADMTKKRFPKVPAQDQKNFQGF